MFYSLRHDGTIVTHIVMSDTNVEPVWHFWQRIVQYDVIIVLYDVIIVQYDVTIIQYDITIVQYDVTIVEPR